MMLWTVFLSLLPWLLVGAHPLQRRQGDVSESVSIASESSDVQSSSAETTPFEASSSSPAADLPSVTVTPSSPPPTAQQNGITPSSTLTDHSTAGPATATSTKHTTTTSTTTLTSTQMSTVTLFVTSTNFVTTVITTAEDTATSTCHTTVTTTVQSPERRQFTWAMGKLQQAMLPTPSLAANRHPFQRVATTTTQLAIEFNISTATTTELMPSTTTVTLVSVTDVPVTSFVYDGAKTTVTLNSTHTVTTTLPKPPASTTAVFSSIPFPSPEPTPIPPPASPPNPGMPTKTKAAIGAGAAALGSLLAIASIAYRHYRKKQAAKRDTSSSALAVQHYNNYGKFSKTSGHRMDLEGREPTIPNLRPIPGYRGTTRTGVLTKRNIHGPVLVNMAEKAAMTEIAARRRLPMVGPRQSPHTSTQSQQEQSPSPSDHKGKEKALPLWQGGTTPPYGKFREHIDEETDPIFGSFSRPVQAAHLKRLPVTDHTGRFAPGSKEHGRFSAVDWKPVPPRQELGGEKKKPAWELPVEEVDGDAAGREVENDMTSSVYSDAEEIVDGRK